MPNAAANTLVSPSASVLPSGAVIGQKYRIDTVLVEGGMGVVYKGFHLGLEKPVAIKVVRAEFAQQPEAVARFLNEARAAAQLRGIHVAHVLDTGRTDAGFPYLVMEYLEGCDLRVILQDHKRLPSVLAVDYVLQACEAVAEAHAAGIVHRDLKPENLFLAKMPDGNELIKVIDFGISKRLGASERSFTMAGQTLGSPHYMAPEQMRHPEQVEPPADIWSLGVVLYELLSGEVPFEGESLPAVCLRVCSERPRSLAAAGIALPAALEHVVMRCLEKDPSARYQDVHELMDALAPFGGPTHTSAVRRLDLLGGVLAPAQKSKRSAASYNAIPASLRANSEFSAVVLKRSARERLESEDPRGTTGMRSAWDNSAQPKRRASGGKIAVGLAVGLSVFALSPIFADSSWLSGGTWKAGGSEVLSTVKGAVASALGGGVLGSSVLGSGAASVPNGVGVTANVAAAQPESDPQKSASESAAPTVTVDPVSPESASATPSRRVSRARPTPRPTAPPNISVPKLNALEQQLLKALPSNGKPEGKNSTEEQSTPPAPRPAPTPAPLIQQEQLDQLMDPYSSK